MYRVGIGYDIHRLVPGGPLILGGVRIEFEKGLLGHSDADVLTHAIIDALLGAAALGNIGQLFPDTDPQYKDADSLELLKETVRRIQAAHLEIVNIDANVIAERPKLLPMLDHIRDTLAGALETARERISVKAKTNEGLGAEGRGESMSAQAVVMLRQT